MSGNNLTTIDKFLETFTGSDTFDAKKIVKAIRDACGKIPANGEYDSAIVGKRIGEYIYAIQECGKFLASLGMVEKFQETEVDKEFAEAANVRAIEMGYTTDGKCKLYAQMDEKYIQAKKKLIEIQGAFAYIDNYRTSLDKAHLHCKKILDRNKDEFRIAPDHERFGGENDSKDLKWVDEKKLME
jgi:hypothetical protein